MNRSHVKKATTLFVMTTSLVVASLLGCTDSGLTSNSVNVENADPLFQTKNIANFELSGSKKLVLTFDDGPSEVTPVLLDVLRIYNIKATFFVLGQNAKKHPEIMKRMRDEGHVIANHSYSHDALNKNIYAQDINALMHEVVDSDRAIRPFMNPAHPRFFRAPYGAWTASHAAKLNQIPSVRDYIGPIFWNVGGSLVPNIQINSKTGKVTGHRPRNADEIQSGADWDCWGASKKYGYKALSVDVCLAGYLKETRRKEGGVILMHDLTLNTVDMASQMIPILLNEGYEFVNLNDVRELEQYQHIAK